jgi:hypothetical protein
MTKPKGMHLLMHDKKYSASVFPVHDEKGKYSGLNIRRLMSWVT